MKTATYIPNNQYYLDKVWISASDNFSSKGILFPMQYQEIVFNQSASFSVKNDPDKSSDSFKSGWISGIHTEPIKIESVGRLLAMGFLLQPWGLYRLTGLNTYELKNQAIEVSDILTPSLCNYFQEHLASGTFMNNPAMADQHLSKNHKLTEVEPHFIRTANILMQSTTNNGLIKRYISEINTSAKTYINTFKKIFGLTPLKFLHLHLVNRSMKEISENPEKKLTQVAFNNGFYDQAHFIKVFKSFTGISPNQYRKYLTNGIIIKENPNYVDELS